MTIEFSATALPGFHGWHSPSYIMDYPTLADDIVVIAHWNGKTWPDGARTVYYLGRRGLWNHMDANAMTFETKDQAYEWLIAHNVVIHTGAVTTIGELKALVGYPQTPWRRIPLCA